MTLKAKVTKEEDKLGYIKIENFCAAKNTIMKVEIQSKEREKIFANHCLPRGLYLHYIKKQYNSLEK